MSTLSLPPGDFRAYLFDLDGTVANSMPVHFLAWTQAMEEAGGRFPEELFYAWGGTPVVRTVELLNEQFGFAMPPEATAHRKEQLYYERMHEVQPMVSVLEHIEREHGRIPFAIVSGSGRESIQKTLTLLGLLDRFDLIVGAEDYARGKPDPQPFLIAAERLGIAPQHCLVFEDADAGIAAAKAAGMRWVRVPPQPHVAPAGAKSAGLESNR